VRPFLKWAGGKTQLLPELVKRVPNFSGRYYEPFVGGGALFFHMRELWPSSRVCVLGDVNADLICAYSEIRTNMNEVIERLRACAREHDEEFYYGMRALELGDDSCARAVRFIYLNKTGFNGLYRVNRQGKFNVPWGKKRAFVVETETLLLCSNALRTATLMVGQFDSNERVKIPPRTATSSTSILPTRRSRRRHPSRATRRTASTRRTRRACAITLSPASVAARTCSSRTRARRSFASSTRGRNGAWRKSLRAATSTRKAADAGPSWSS
jgi:hypothetical protein